MRLVGSTLQGYCVRFGEEIGGVTLAPGCFLRAFYAVNARRIVTPLLLNFDVRHMIGAVIDCYEDDQGAYVVARIKSDQVRLVKYLAATSVFALRPQYVVGRWLIDDRAAVVAEAQWFGASLAPMVVEPADP